MYTVDLFMDYLFPVHRAANNFWKPVGHDVRKNKILSDIYKNLSDINFYKMFLKTLIKFSYCWETFLHLFIRAEFTPFALNKLESNLCYSQSIKVSTAFKVKTWN